MTKSVETVICEEAVEQAKLLFQAKENLKRERKHNNRFLRKIGMHHTMAVRCRELFSVKTSQLWNQDYYYTKSECVVCGHIEESIDKKDVDDMI